MSSRFLLHHVISIGTLIVLTAPQAVWATPKLVCPEPEVDLGRMKQFEKREHVFFIGNHGTTALEIKKVASSCVCTTPKKLRPDQRIIPPGGSVKIPVTFNSKEKFGLVHSQATVHTNDPQNPEFKLRLRAYVETLYTISPKNYFFSNLSRSKPTPKPILILAGALGEKLELVELTCPLEGVEVLVEDYTESRKNVEQLENRSGFAVRLRFDSTVPLGQVKTELVGMARVGTNTKEIKIPVVGSLVGDLVVQPLHVTNPLAAKRGIQIGTIKLRANQSASVTASAAIPRDDFLLVELIETEPKRLYAVNISLAKDAPAGPLASAIDIYTNSLDQPVTTVPVLLNAEPLIKLSPPSVYIDGSEVRTRQATVTLTTTDKSPLTVKVVESADPDVLVEILPSEEKKQEARVRISLKPGAKPGEHNTRITLRTDVPGAARLVLPVRAVVGEVTKASAQ